MYNAKLSIELLKVEPYSDKDKGDGLNVLAKLETKDRKFFDDINFAGKEEGLSRILSGELPIKGNKIPLKFVKPSLEMEFGESKHIPVELVELATAPIADGKISIFIKLNVNKLDKELAGELGAKIKDFVEIKLKKLQDELPLHTSKVMHIDNQ
jgi:hypothetical protein